MPLNVKTKVKVENTDMYYGSQALVRPRSAGTVTNVYDNRPHSSTELFCDYGGTSHVRVRFIGLYGTGVPTTRGFVFRDDALQGPLTTAFPVPGQSAIPYLVVMVQPLTGTANGTFNIMAWSRGG